MRRGFIFQHSLCVNCKACSAACVLDNNFTVKPRTIFTYNKEAEEAFPLTNLSVACNHCEVAACMIGCPASAYLRDPLSDAVLIDDKKCIGCEYCIWNCPWEAPKYDPVNRVIGKCHLCFRRLESDMMPACADGCPTGALSFGNIGDPADSGKPDWFSGEELNPAVEFKGRMAEIPLKIIPHRHPENIRNIIVNDQRIKDTDWSLILFSFLAVMSVSLLASSLVKGVVPGKLLFLTLTLLPGVFSFFHLGRPTRAWRALTNIKNSPLSREIMLYLIYVIISCISVIYESPELIVASVLTGLLFLVSIDSVYIYSARSIPILLNSGQTFLTSLLIISFLSGRIIPFLFVAFIKLTLSLYAYFSEAHSIERSVLRFIRMALLIIPGASMVSGTSYPETPVVALFIAGEILDRIFFYTGFKPGSLSVSINNKITLRSDGKEKD